MSSIKMMLSMGVLILMCSCASKELVIKPLYPFERRDTISLNSDSGLKEIAVFKYFFVENWNVKDSSKIEDLSEFARKQLEKEYAHYRQYHVSFFKRTNVLNEKYDSTSTSDIAWHAEDLCAELRSSAGQISFNIYNK